MSRVEISEPAPTAGATVVLVDDDPAMLRAISTLLRNAGHEVLQFHDAASALEALATNSQDVDLVFTDLRMPGMDGLMFLGELRKRWPDLPVVMLTAHGGVEEAVEAMRRGAHHYLIKTCLDAGRITKTVESAASRRRVLRDLGEGPSAGVGELAGIVGGGPAMRQVYRLVEAAAATDATVLLLGESGTGKELIARALHARSARRDGPFLPVNCAALTDTLLESELFGHVRGAFSGASQHRTGVFEQASKGTLFLDEIGDISAKAQITLLRALQEGEIRPVGSSTVQHVSPRVVAATNRDLALAVKDRAFREDLYYRLNVVTIELPRLRDRREDIPALVQHFIDRYSRRHGKAIAGLHPDALQRLLAHSWPGNVRELENTLHRAVVFATGSEITERELPASLGVGRAPPVIRSWGQPYAEAKQAVVADFERQFVESALMRGNGCLSTAARLAGLDRANFRRLVRRHDIDVERFRSNSVSSRTDDAVRTG